MEFSKNALKGRYIQMPMLDPGSKDGRRKSKMGVFVLERSGAALKQAQLHHRHKR